MADQEQNRELSDAEIAAVLTGRAETKQDDPPQETRPVNSEPETWKARLDEEIERRRNAERMRDQLMERQIAAGSQNGQPEPNLDPEVAETINPFFDRFRREIGEELAPIRQFVQRQLGEQALKSTIPNFDEVKPEIAEQFRSLSPEDRQRYDTAGEIGAMALYAKVLQNRLGSQTGSFSPDRAHTQVRGTTSPNRGQLTDQDVAKRIENMTTEEWATFRRQLEGG